MNNGSFWQKFSNGRTHNNEVVLFSAWMIWHKMLSDRWSFCQVANVYAAKKANHLPTKQLVANFSTIAHSVDPIEIDQDRISISLEISTSRPLRLSETTLECVAAIQHSKKVTIYHSQVIIAICNRRDRVVGQKSEFFKTQQWNSWVTFWSWLYRIWNSWSIKIMHHACHLTALLVIFEFHKKTFKNWREIQTRNCGLERSIIIRN